MSQHKVRAFQRSVAPWLGRLFRTAYRLTGNVPDAEDLVQDTCVAAYEKLDAVGAMDHPDRWLLRVMYNRFIDGARRQTRAPVVNLGDGNESSDFVSAVETQCGLDDLTDRERAFRDACDRLSDSHRVLLSLRAEGYALPEIAQITGIDITVLRGRLHRARENLARHLADEKTADGLKRRLGSKQ